MIPLAELKSALRIDADQDAHDADLLRLEPAAVAACERVTGRYFGPPATLKETVEGTGQRELWLRNEPHEVASVTIVGNPGGALAQLVPATFYAVRGRRLVGAGGWGYESWPHEYEVVYSAGYEPGTEPADVRQAVHDLVALWFEQRIPGAVPPRVDELLSPWKIVRA